MWTIGKPETVPRNIAQPGFGSERKGDNGGYMTNDTQGDVENREGWLLDMRADSEGHRQQRSRCAAHREE
jgi:hypothetical protein